MVCRINCVCMIVVGTGNSDKPPTMPVFIKRSDASNASLVISSSLKGPRQWAFEPHHAHASHARLKYCLPQAMSSAANVQCSQDAHYHKLISGSVGGVTRAYAPQACILERVPAEDPPSARKRTNQQEGRSRICVCVVLVLVLVVVLPSPLLGWRSCVLCHWGG